MRPDSRHRRTIDEDRVDELWDRINGTLDGRAQPLSQSSADTIDPAAATISLLATIVPPVEEESLARIRQKFNAGVDKEIAMRTVTRGEPASGELPQLKQASTGAPNRIRQVPKTVNWIAAAVLILAVVGSAFVAGAGRSTIAPDSRPMIEALPGFANQSEVHRPGEGSLVSIDLTPATAPYSPIEVGVWELTLPVGTGIQIPPLNSFGDGPFAFQVISGTVRAGFPLGEAYEHFVGAGDGSGLGTGWEYVRNVNPSPATIWVIAPFPSHVGAGSDFRFSPWNPAPNLAGTPQKSGAAGAIQTRELMRVPVSIADGKDVGVTLGFYNVAPGPIFTDLLSYRTRSIHVLDGQFDVSKAPNTGTSIPATTVRQGQNHRVTAETPLQTYKATGTEHLKILTVSVQPSIRIPVIPSPQPSLPPVTEWSSMGGPAEMTIRLVTMQPKASYQLTTSSGVIYQLVDGEVDAVANDRTGSKTLLPGQSIGQATGRGLVLTNSSDKVAHVLQGIVSTTSLMPNSDSPANYELKVDVEILKVANAKTSLGKQDFTLSLSTGSLEPEAQLSIQSPTDSILLAVAEGEVLANRQSGPLEFKPSQTADPVDASVGDSIAIGVGGQVFAQPGSGFSLKDSMEASKIVRLSIAPKTAASATPEAPVSTPQINEATKQRRSPGE
jgi:hypothetical protein